MPVISVTLLPGYAPEVQHRLVQRLAVTARSVIAAADAGTTVFIQEVSTYQRDGKVFTGGGAARPVASEVVMAFLNWASWIVNISFGLIACRLDRETSLRYSPDGCTACPVERRICA